jgi:sugar phosphate isomerase/epimerase
MRLSFSTAALFPRDSIESLELIAKSGLKEAELMPQCMNDMTEAFAKEAATKLHVSSIHYPLAMFGILYNAHVGMLTEARELSSQLLKSAHIMGTEVIVIHPHIPGYTQWTDQLLDPILDNITDMCDKAAKFNITIAVENNPRTAGPTPEKLWDYVAAFNHPQLKTMVDTTESFEASIDPVEFIRVAKPMHMHLSDHAGGLKHINAGEGEMDWPAIMAELKSQNFNGIHVLEPSYKYYMVGEAEAVQIITKSKNFLEQFA